MKPDELEACTSAEVRALLEAWKLREQRADYRIAQLCVLTGEINRDRDKKPEPFQVYDFFASLSHLRPPPPTADELAEKLRWYAQVSQEQADATR